MRRAVAVALILLAALGSPEVRAAEDDLLVVTGDSVNVRDGPGKDQRVVGKLTRGQIVVELEQRGEWFHIDMGGGRDGGWVHRSLLQVLPDEGVALGPGSAAFQAFRQALERESRRVLAATGTYPYMVAEDLGEGMVVVTPSEDWLIGGGDLTDDAWALYRLWKSHNDSRPVTLAITDERGNIYITIQDTATEPLLTVHH
jgi:N-acetylmuramoyl-L-alanine amidase